MDDRQLNNISQIISRLSRLLETLTRRVDELEKKLEVSGASGELGVSK
jgi:hypothetical protein